MTFLESVKSYRRPGTPQPHGVSKVSIPGADHQRIVTGRFWHESSPIATELMSGLEGLLKEFNAAFRQASTIALDPDMRPEAAGRRAAEKRMPLLHPAIDRIHILGSKAVEKAFGSVLALESEILGISAPTPAASDIDRLRQTMLDIEIRSEFHRQMADASGDGPTAVKFTALALLSEFSAVEDWNSFAAIENARPSLMISDFKALRRAWALETHPEIKPLLNDKTAIAKYVVSLASAACGLANLASYRITQKIAGDDKIFGYTVPADSQSTWLKFGSQVLRDGGERPISITEVGDEGSDLHGRSMQALASRS